MEGVVSEQNTHNLTAAFQELPIAVVQGRMDQLRPTAAISSTAPLLACKVNSQACHGESEETIVHPRDLIGSTERPTVARWEGMKPGSASNRFNQARTYE